MSSVLRLSPSRVGLAYIALSVLALALFAIPLWFAWQTNLSTFKAYVHGADVQRLVDVFDREGASGLAAAMDAEAASLPRSEIMVFADTSKRRLAGNLPSWPPEVPDAPGAYGLVISLGEGASTRVVVSHVTLPGGYHLLLGGESVLLQSFIERFWYGIAGAIAIVLLLGAAIGWLIRRALLVEVQEISRTASAIATGDLSRRLETRGGSPALDALARTVNEMLARLASQNVHLESEVGVRRQAEQALQGARDELEEVVEQRTAELAGANEALRLSEERYARAMEAVGEGHWEWNLATDEMFLSERTKVMLGFARDERFASCAEFFGRQPIHPDDRQRVADARDAVLSGATSRCEVEYRVVPRPGEVRWVRSRGKLFPERGGAPARMSGSVTDITEQKDDEEALRISEERYARAMDASDAGHWDWNVLTGEMFQSARMKQLLGFPADTRFAGRNDWVARIPFHPDDRRRVEDAIAATLGGTSERYEVDYRIVLQTRETRWVRARGRIYRDGQGRAIRVAGSLFDITEAKAAEDELRLRKDELQGVMDSISDYLWSAEVAVDGAFAYRYYSPAVERITGWPPEYFIESPERWLGTSHSLDRPMVAAAFERITSGATDREDAEYRIVRRDGALRWVRDSMHATRRDDGRIVLNGVVSDITERKRIEDALRLSEARYARAMDASADGLWEWNPTTDELFTSPRARELWGIPDGVEIRTRAALKTQNLQFTEDTIRECIAQPSGVEMTYSVLNQAGALRWVRCVGKVFLGEHGEPMLVTGSLTDVTERKLAADALRLSEEELRARQDMLDLAQKAARAVAFEWHIGAGEGENRWSPDLEIMYGLEPGSYDGTYETWKKLVFPADWPAVKAAIKRANETGDIAAEYRVVYRDGAVRWLQAKGRMFFDDERKPTRMVGFMLDVTDRHQAEEELRRLERQLRQAQRLEAMGTLAGGIAHDFNNILGAILGYGEMATRDAKKGTRLHRDLDSIMAAGERGRALIDRILAFSRSGVGERVPVHVQAVVREALDQAAARLPGSVTVSRRLRAGRAATLGDSTQVHQVVMNLAANAVQAMPQGGVLHVALETVRVDAARAATVGAIARGDYIVLRVSDTGTGIPEDVLERMFDPFFTTKEVGVGTGLGLSLVHGIVTSVGGAIDVATERGKGTTFTVHLRRSGDATEGPTDESRPLPRGEGQRVLVVDDEEPLVRLATETLEELGYVALGFTSSTAALEAIRADPQRFDALITDERMPGMTGSALIREVRVIRAAIPVVLMSGYLGMESVDADVVVRKPLSMRDLATSLARVLQP